MTVSPMARNSVLQQRLIALVMLGKQKAAVEEITELEEMPDLNDLAVRKVAGTPQHGLSSKNMALVTPDYGIMRSLSIKWP